jgi:hypothetical protein
MPKAVADRKLNNPEAGYLSDWQIHSAHITAVTINFITSGYQTGPLYVPMPTGSGKTTGAIWGIVDFVKKYPDQKLCFLTPYKTSIDTVYKALLKYLTKEQVGYYYAGALVTKADELSKQVILLTHQFLSFNQGALDNRDVFVVDEAIYATGEASLKLKQLAEARAWATSNVIMADEFNDLWDFAVAMEKDLRNGHGIKHLAAPTVNADLSWANAIAFDLNLAHHSQTIKDHELLNGVKRFCEALTQGMVFISNGATKKGSSDPVFSAAVFGIPRMDKTIVLSATGGLLYSITGPFKQDHGSKDYWTPPSYKNLKLVQLSGPSSAQQYKNWNTDKIKNDVVTYVDWLIRTVPENTLYITVPKQVLDKCLKGSFGIPTTGDLTLPKELKVHDKIVHLSHHVISVGSNKFKDCDAVIYLWDNHLPSSLAVQRFHTLADQPITDISLEDANGKNLVGDYQRIRDAQYIDNTMQHIGRGNIRNINTEAEVGEMTAYVLSTKTNMFPRVAAQYRGCQLEKLEYETPIEQPTGRIERILFYLQNLEAPRDVSAKEVEGALGFRLSSYRQKLEDSWDLSALGYSYKAGAKGKGNVAIFIWRHNKTKPISGST